MDAQKNNTRKSKMLPRKCVRKKNEVCKLKNQLIQVHKKEQLKHEIKN